MPTKSSISSRLNCIDLFSGCGGLSLGLEQAGFHPVFVSEINPNALESYLINRQILEPHLRDPSFHVRDIKNLRKPGRMKALRGNLKTTFGLNTDNGDIDLIVGGPPCQGFSGIGHRRSYSVERKKLPSSRLFAEMAWIIKNLQPKIFLFENVRGLLTSKWTTHGTSGEIWEDVQNTFSTITGYAISSATVLSREYGVPQNRPRVLLVGVRSDIDTSIWDTEMSGVANNFLPAPSGEPPNLVDLLGDLIDQKYQNGGATSKYLRQPTHGSQKLLRTTRDGSILKKGDPLTEQVYSKHNDAVVRKFQHMIDNRGTIHWRFKTKKFAQRLLPAKWNTDGPTITATSLPDDYVHFSQPRILTVREWARLQGFPDWYLFSGPRTTGGLRRAGNPRAGIFDREIPKYTQIGNAVPVELARRIGLHFAKLLDPERSNSNFKAMSTIKRR